jgi:hypothetical protein
VNRRKLMKPFKWITGSVMVLMICLPLSSQGDSLQLPETVTLDALTHLYEGAEFDHEMHLDIAADCTVCHHHAAGVPTTNERCARCHGPGDVLEAEACVTCHAIDPFSAEAITAKEADPGGYHIDRPGLKAAYHLNCLNCHVEMGGPAECEDCHERTEAGDAFYHSGKYAPSGEAASSAH